MSFSNCCKKYHLLNTCLHLKSCDSNELVLLLNLVFQNSYMKKLYTLIFISILFQSKAQCNYTLFTSSYNGFTITCANPTLNLYSFTNSTNNVTYVWSGPSFTSNLPTANITTPGTYTCISTEAITNCTIPAIFSIGINTTIPQSTVTPSTLSVTCNNPATFTSTAISPTTNVEHSWMTPLPGARSSNFSTSVTVSTDLYAGTGTYTYTLKDLNNGCKTTQTVTVTSLNAYPTFSIYSPTNFSIGCSPLNQTTISIINPVSTQTPPATCSFTFLPPSFGGVVTPSVILAGNSSTVTSTPGAWSLMVQDNSSFCRTMTEVVINQNTLAPHLAVSIPNNTITCFNQTIAAVGTSTTNNTTVEWPAFPPLMVNYPNTVAIGPPNGPPTSTIALFYTSYTVIATNTLNGCSTTSYVPVYQDFREPKSLPAAFSTPTSICKPGVDLVALNSNNSYVTSAGPNGSISVVSWMGPAPQQSATGTTYSAYVSGDYTLVVRDTYNGCTASGTVFVPSAQPQFFLSGIAPTTSVSCDGSVTINSQIPTGYSLTASTGSLNGVNITNLCYGWLKVCMTFTPGGCFKCDSILINGATAINELNLEELFSLYPNPTSSSFMIKNLGVNTSEVKIYNGEGKVIEEMKFEKEIEIKNLNSGFYFVEINVEGAVLRKKVVVIR